MTTLLRSLQSIEPNPSTLAGERFRKAAQIIAKQVILNQPTPIDEESLEFPE